MGQKRASNRFPRLTIRGHTYYIRVAIPKDIREIFKHNDIKYSLNTKDYYIAIKQVRISYPELKETFEKLKAHPIEKKRLPIYRPVRG